ncbi:hypothetical protein PHYPSEUDO_008488 [Phytophthora pseudosyringae]|uniref:Origin recognition complex subunit 3 N-terminal domain-containing protein n=1 Tax=Phytophthora pseudosyringae TaxID=221518 RepID=A0A8T1VE06_9STRA|nr:hypothetical protein PHYPSEUDO_008488 [Phytophthora pseudosyringae]
MEAAAFSTGVSIQYPHGRAAARFSSTHHSEKAEYPFAFPAGFKTSSERQYRADTEAYSVCQELAYHFACETTRRAVQELLHKNNDTSYSQVLRFFEKYCARDAPVAAANGSATGASPSGRRLRDPNAPVLCPNFHGFPTAAVIAGTDATSSDLWVEPLTHKLRRTFPLCVLVQRDISTARRFIEWLAARMAKLCAAKLREEKWLEALVDNFDLLPLDQPPVVEGGVGGRLTRHRRAGPHADTGVSDDREKGDKDGQSDGSFFDSSSGSEASGDDGEFDASRRRGEKKKRRLASVAYGRWTMSKLLTSIQHDVDELLSPNSGDTCREWVAMLGELVHDRLQEALTLVRKVQHKEDEMVIQSIACLDEAVAWLQRKISTCRDTAAKLLNVAPESASNGAATTHIGSTEMALATMLQRVFLQYSSLLEECTLDRPTINDRRKSVQKEMVRHENYYTLKDNNPDALIQLPSQSPSTPRPFLLLCIEQLEAFSQQVFGEFLEIWTHFVQQQQENGQRNATSGTLGFVIGVASATSPALRRLDLTVTNRLELQFFSLVDSRKCFDDVLESLVVKAKLPLALSGEVLRSIASRHHRLPSVPRLLLALRFLIFTHFRRCPWGFLALAVDGLASSGESPILTAADVTPLPHRVSAWVKRQRRRLTREAQARCVESDSALASWLAPCSAVELADLASRVMPSKTSPGVVVGEENWITVLESALLHERRRQARWRMSWECFRSACSWLDVHLDGRSERDHNKQEQVAVTHLALALEGRLGEAPRFVEVLRRLQNCRWAVLSAMIGDWQSAFRTFGSYENNADDLETALSELAILCAYARTEKTPAKMLVALREELVTVFTTRLISALLHPSAPGTSSPAAALVSSWSVLTDASVLETRLRFEYHDHLRNVLQDAGIGEAIDTSTITDADTSWVHDVGLAFLFYQESASASLSLREWYESFSSELEGESTSASNSTKKSKNRKAAHFSDDPAIKARFVRAVCTLRHWGFIKSDAPRDSEQDLIEKLVFI